MVTRNSETCKRFRNNTSKQRHSRCHAKLGNKDNWCFIRLKVLFSLFIRGQKRLVFRKRTIKNKVLSTILWESGGGGGGWYFSTATQGPLALYLWSLCLVSIIQAPPCPHNYQQKFNLSLLTIPNSNMYLVMYTHAQPQAFLSLITIPIQYILGIFNITYTNTYLVPVTIPRH